MRQIQQFQNRTNWIFYRFSRFYVRFYSCLHFTSQFFFSICLFGIIGLFVYLMTKTKLMWNSISCINIIFPLIFFVHLFTELKAVVLGTADLYVKTGSDINLTCKISKGPHELGTVFWYKGIFNKLIFSPNNYNQIIN